MNTGLNNNNKKPSFSDKLSLLSAVVAGLITGAFLMSAFTYSKRGDWPSYLLSATAGTTKAAAASTTPSPIQMTAIVHYATSKVVPQQNLAEITQSLEVLRVLSPCNFLVFGLGHDSLMWASLNPGGTTLFLEEDPQWVQTVLKDSPFLNARTVPYRTHLSEADQLLQAYKEEPDCHPSRTFLKGNRKCRLALESLPEEVYEREWDVIMIDAPRGYFPAAPGRMAAIYSAAVMGRRRKKHGITHVFLHDVDRKVEKEFAREFLCMKNKVGGAGRLWHFEIPSVTVRENNVRDTTKFC